MDRRAAPEVREKTFPAACSIGSIDPTGAAGITADLRVFARLGVAGAAVVAAVTAQNSRHVRGVHGLSPAAIRGQFAAVWEQARPRALCIGLLPTLDAIETVRRFLRTLDDAPAIVIDPVITASSGYAFLGAREVRALRTLLPLATIVTPNLREAALLSSRRVTTFAQAESAALALARFGCAVLVTGGHLKGDACIDVLARDGAVQRYKGVRIAGTMRGAGGVLAAALTAQLARGARLEDAVVSARRFVRREFPRARRLGSGKPQLR